ncbi:hypothetical protein SKAU_G00396810 [Synaphobranchus kaupii]|uniref:Fibroblast growth factor-binding protein 1 n=1 Tax=Synaphobranchus kaupii TaxID=118154 RepID=A0A9Q1ECQ2_SYNKA|nr:hypothetical protein SKAU_G00396810 [Synaphobranchus kaupii]
MAGGRDSGVGYTSTGISLPHLHSLLRHWFPCSVGKTHAAGGDMVIRKHFALVLFLACVAQQVLVIDCEKGRGRAGRRDGKGKESGGEYPLQERPAAAGDGNSQFGKPFLKGKFSTKDKTQCTWLADEEDTVTLGVVCSKGGVGFNCEYSARPGTCAPYASNVKVYWKQIARALKKQKNICQDATALVKAGMCKKAPKDAHFKLLVSGPTPPAVQPEESDNKSCSDKIDQKNLAEEYCSGPWVTLCNFFFTMVQSEDC